MGLCVCVCVGLCARVRVCARERGRGDAAVAFVDAASLLTLCRPINLGPLGSLYYLPCRATSSDHLLDSVTGWSLDSLLGELFCVLPSEVLKTHIFWSGVGAAMLCHVPGAENSSALTTWTNGVCVYVCVIVCVCMYVC